jgi:hypothetical protein
LAFGDRLQRPVNRKVSVVQATMTVVTLTIELANPESAAARFLQEHLPARSRVLAIWADQVGRQPQVVTALDWGARAAVGGAIEWRIGLDLADSTPYLDVLTMLPDLEVARILTTAGLQPPAPPDVAAGQEFGVWCRPDHWAPGETHDQLLRDAWLLCQYAGLLRRVREPDPVQWRSLHRILWDTVGGSDLVGDVLGALHVLWRAYVTRGRDRLLALGRPRVIRPVFDDAFAVGDLVLGGTLVDIKTYVDPGASLATFLDQLLGYVLFDVEDRFAIRSVGIYLSWQADVLTMPLEELLRLASGQNAFDLYQARRGFRERVAPALDKSRFYKHGTTQARNQP